MKKILFSAIMLMFAVSAVIAAKGAVHGVAADPNAPALDMIKYVGNNAGYQFWFTVTADIGPYKAGHSYHNVYKYFNNKEEVVDPDWMGPVIIPDRAPYNLAGIAGESVWYKIIDVSEE